MDNNFRKLLDSLFRSPFDDIFRVPSEDEITSKEVFTFEKGNYKTEVSVYFDKDGYVVSTYSRSEPKEHKNLESLREKLDIAVKAEDYTEAAQLQKQIKEIESQQNK